MRHLIGGLWLAAGYFMRRDDSVESWARTLREIEALPVYAGYTLDNEPCI